ncbi:hypothetical protein LK08_11160 [Streptomyces sp. MUSC 125]|nr:hypothetical protein LK08_11160 [Streptomyces sp. MUSC 125]
MCRHFELPLPMSVICELLGVAPEFRIPAGTPVLVGYSAAGRDPAAHGPDAERFGVARPAWSDAVRHLSLGHGAHYCLGAPLLARLEVTLAREHLFTRFSDVAQENSPDLAQVPRWLSAAGGATVPGRLCGGGRP